MLPNLAIWKPILVKVASLKHFVTILYVSINHLELVIIVRLVLITCNLLHKCKLVAVPNVNMKDMEINSRLGPILKMVYTEKFVLINIKVMFPIPILIFINFHQLIFFKHQVQIKTFLIDSLFT